MHRWADIVDLELRQRHRYLFRTAMWYIQKGPPKAGRPDTLICTSIPVPLGDELATTDPLSVPDGPACCRTATYCTPDGFPLVGGAIVARLLDTSIAMVPASAVVHLVGDAMVVFLQEEGRLM